MSRNLSEEEREMRLRLVRQGCSYSEIGRQCGVSRQAVHRWVRAEGITKPRAAVRERQGTRMKTAYTLGIVLGMAWAAVGKKLDTDNDNACQLARRYASYHSLPWRYRGNGETLPPMELGQ